MHDLIATSRTQGGQPYLFQSIDKQHIDQYTEFMVLAKSLRNNPDVKSWKGLANTVSGQLHACLHRHVPCIYTLRRLDHGVWLDGNIIDAYLSLVKCKGIQTGKDTLSDTYMGASTMFAKPWPSTDEEWFKHRVKHTGGQKLLLDGYVFGGQKPHIMRFKHILFPVLVGDNHWILLHISPGTRTIEVHDSLNTVQAEQMKRVYGHVMFWVLKQEKSLRDLDGMDGLGGHSGTPGVQEQAPKEWTFAPPRSDLPTQLNCYDCGLFICMYARYIAAEKCFDFDQEHMPHMRVAMLLELLSYHV